MTDDLSIRTAGDCGHKWTLYLNVSAGRLSEQAVIRREGGTKEWSAESRRWEARRRYHVILASLWAHQGPQFMKLFRAQHEQSEADRSRAGDVVPGGFETYEAAAAYVEGLARAALADSAGSATR